MVPTCLATGGRRDYFKREVRAAQHADVAIAYQINRLRTDAGAGERRGPRRAPWTPSQEIPRMPQGAAHDTTLIRNFSIVAHIDHGKSTLADQFLLKTGAISPRDFRAQVLDDMDLERERGITIQMHPVTIYYPHEGVRYELNLIDTPGHVDFNYEVSRSLAACEGAILLVDAFQGVQAQTVANAYLAMEHDLTIVPVLNKIDLPVARPDDVIAEMETSVGVIPSEVLRASGKSGIGVKEVLD